MYMLAQLRMFGMNIYLIIGALIVLGFLLVVLLVGWTGIKMWFWHMRMRRGQAEAERGRVGPGGKRLPPTGSGLCHRCGQPGKVYHLPSGERLCPMCYGKSSKESA
ncbi:MAG: hypothetical protein PVJ57_09540 [Phycisphaerae bacterium]|jgi:hypothetical protein